MQNEILIEKEFISALLVALYIDLLEKAVGPSAQIRETGLARMCYLRPISSVTLLLSLSMKDDDDQWRDYLTSYR